MGSTVGVPTAIIEAIRASVTAQLVDKMGVLRNDAKRIKEEAKNSSDIMIQAVHFYLNCRVVKSQMILRNRDPWVTVTLKFEKTTVTVDDRDNKILSQLMSAEKLVRGIHYYVDRYSICDDVMKMLPPEREALFQADVVNSRARALADPKRKAILQERLNKARAADRERYVAELRGVLRRHDGLIDEEDLVRIWRENLVANIMES